MTRYRIDVKENAGETIQVLRDSKTSASASVWPGFGNNCIEARLPAQNGRLVDMLLAPESLDELRQHPAGSGIPLLFPSPSKIPGGEYEFEGQRYTMPGVDASGDAWHGFVKDRPWRVEKAVADEQQAVLVSSISARDHPDLADGYPFAFRLEAEYRLDETGLTLQTRVFNLGEGPMPFGFGAHPYFRIPFSPRGKRAACRITIPASRRWDLRRITDLEEVDRLTREMVTDSITKGNDYRESKLLGEMLFDDAVTDLELSTQGWVECTVTDPTARLAGVMRATGNFETLVLYTPPKRPGLCFEPWTCPPNAFNLVAKGLRHIGLVVLAPRERWEGIVRLFLRPT